VISFVFYLLVVTAGLPRSGKLPILNLLTGQKSGFSLRRGTNWGQTWQGRQLPVLTLLTGQKSGFSPAGATRCTDSRQTSQGRRAHASTWLYKISPQSPQGWEFGPQKKYQKFQIYGKESPHRGDSFDRFQKFSGAFTRLIILHKCFKFYMIRFTGYGVIAEKPRVGKLGQIFPCTLYEKLCVGSKKWMATFMTGTTSSITIQSLGRSNYAPRV